MLSGHSASLSGARFNGSWVAVIARVAGACNVARRKLRIGGSLHAFPAFSRTRHAEATVADHRVSGHVQRVLAGKEHHDRHEVPRVADRAQWRVVDKEFPALRRPILTLI